MRQPSEIHSDIDDINEKIHTLLEDKEDLKQELRDVHQSYVKDGPPCPECGSDKMPEEKETAHSVIASCVNPDCDYIAKTWN